MLGSDQPQDILLSLLRQVACK